MRAPLSICFLEALRTESGEEFVQGNMDVLCAQGAWKIASALVTRACRSYGVALPPNPPIKTMVESLALIPKGAINETVVALLAGERFDGQVPKDDSRDQVLC